MTDAPSIESPAADAETAEPLVVSVDELRAVCRVTDAVLPAFVTDDDAKIEAVDIAALRGLAARGLVALTDDDDLWIADDVQAAVAPTRDARLLVEVDEDTGLDTFTWALVGGDAGPTALMAEYGLGLVTLEVLPAAVTEVVTERCRLDEIRAQVDYLGFTVPRAAHEAMGDAIDEGASGLAAEPLLAAGAPADAAVAFVEALVARKRAMAVQVARNVGTGEEGPFEAAEVRWVEGPDGTAWQLVIELADEDDPMVDDALAGSTTVGEEQEDEVFEARLAAAVHTIGRDALAEAIRHALTPTASGDATGDH